MIPAVYRQIVLSYLAAMMLVFFAASTAQVAAAGTIAQSYATNEKDINKGALVATVAGQSNKVELANSTTNIAKLAGVSADKPLLEFASESDTTVQIVTSGTTEALVSDINGLVKAGDKITASPVSGIGMKAIFAGEVVGTAQADLGSVSTVKQSVDGLGDERQEITVGLLPVAVGVSYYSPPGGAGTLSSFVPDALQSIANTVAGKPVSPARVLFGVAITLLGFAVVAMMLYTSIRGGMNSIGRNPLAEKVVRKGVREITAAAIIILILTVTIVYLILSL